MRKFPPQPDERRVEPHGGERGDVVLLLAAAVAAAAAAAAVPFESSAAPCGCARMSS